MIEQELLGFGSRDLIFILIGTAIVFAALGVWRFIKKLNEEKLLPPVVFIDVAEWDVKVLGYFEEELKVRIPVTNGSSKEFYAIRTIMKNEPYFIVPSFGSKEDMVISDAKRINIYIMMGTLIGFGSEGAPVHEKWMEDAFPEATYDREVAADIPKQFILCRPIWNREMQKSVFVDKMFQIQEIYALFDHMSSMLRENANTSFNQMAILLMNNLLATNDHLLTGWSCITDAWNTQHKERTVALNVLTNLLHISPSRIGYSGLTQALNSGSIQAALPFVNSIKGTIENLADSLGLVTMNKTEMSLMNEKINMNKQEMVGLANENTQYRNSQQELLNQLNEMKQNGQIPSQLKNNNNPITV